MTQPLTWFDLSRLQDGTWIEFATDWDIFPECVVAKGTKGHIVENGLNEIWCKILVGVDDPKVREALRHWDGFVVLGTHLDPGADLHKHPEECTEDENEKAGAWYEASPLALVEAA